MEKNGWIAASVSKQTKRPQVVTQTLVCIDGTLTVSFPLGEMGEALQASQRQKQTQTERDRNLNEKEAVKYEQNITQSRAKLASFPIQFPIHNGAAGLCAGLYGDEG